MDLVSLRCIADFANSSLDLAVEAGFSLSYPNISFIAYSCIERPTLTLLHYQHLNTEISASNAVYFKSQAYLDLISGALK
jgi:hypothetical protein